MLAALMAGVFEELDPTQPHKASAHIKPASKWLLALSELLSLN